jgi:fructan beta-fructosidase
VGNFDGMKFTNDNPASLQLWLDYGKDYYAAISFVGGPPKDSRVQMLGWYSNWLYANDTPETTWRGAMAMPRTMRLTKTAEGIRLMQEPVKEFEALRTQIYSLGGLTVDQLNQRIERDGFKGNSYEIEAEVTPGDAKDFGVSVLRGGEQETVVGIKPTEKQVYVDRTKSGDTGFNKAFASRDAGPIHVGATVKLRVYVDWSGVEVFVNDGETTLAERVFPSPDSRGARLFSDGGKTRIKTLKVWRMKSVWDGK